MGTIGTVQAVFQADTTGFDASLKSAVASLGQVGEQATAASQKVDAATRLQEAAAGRVRRVLAQVAAEQKALAGQNVTDGARKVAEATLEQSKAYTELHRVQGLVRSDAVDEATKTDLLAAAQSRAAESALALAEAKDREAAAAELAGVREALAGQRVTEEALRTTAALRAQAEAQALLGRAQGLARSGAIVGPEATQLVAAAQLRAASTSAEVVEAKRAEAIAVAEAAEEEALSQNVIVRAFQRVAIAARESLDSIKERLTMAVGESGLEAEGISRAFAGLGSALGAGIAVGFAADYIDGLAKMNVELDHLATKTGIDIQQLAGLQQIVKEMGGEWDPVTMGLVRMQRAQVLAVQGAQSAGNAQARAFKDIGISVGELEHMNPEQLFVRVGTAIAGIKDPAVATTAAMGIFGRGGAALIPIFKEQGNQLEANMTKTGKMTGVTEKSAAAARQWTADVAKLSAEFRSVMMPVMEHAEDVVKGVGGAFMAAFTAVDAVLYTAAASVVSLVEEIGYLGKAVGDIAKGNYSAAAGDVASGAAAYKKVWSDTFGEISREGKKTYHLFTDENAPPPALPGGPDDTDLSGLELPAKGPKGDAARKAAEAQMEAFEHGASVLEEQGNADAFTIHGYWSKKIEAMQKGSADYDKLAGSLNSDKVYAKLAESTKRMDAELEKSLHPHKDAADDSFQREQEHAADEQIKRVTEIRQQAADAQNKMQEKAQLGDVSIALSHGEISRYQALVAEAQIHAASFGAEIAEVEKRLADAEALHSLPGMDEEIAKRQAQLAQLKGQAAEQAQIDASAISSQTIGGAFHDALNDWVQQSNDAAALVRKTFTEAATGINEDLAQALTDPARTEYERMQNLKRGLAGTARGIANQGITFGLGKLESTLPGDLGKLFGGGKKPTGAKGDPLYVAFDGGAAGNSAGRAASVASSVNQEIRGGAGGAGGIGGIGGAGGEGGAGREIDTLLNLPTSHPVVTGPGGGGPANDSSSVVSDQSGNSRGYMDALASLAPTATTMAASNPKGLLEPGNLPIWNRPVVKNADGSHSSEYSTSFQDEQGREVLVPSVVGGQFLTPDGTKPPEGSDAEKSMFQSAWQHYLSTGENLGKFDNADNADAYSEILHNRGQGQGGFLDSLPMFAPHGGDASDLLYNPSSPYNAADQSMMSPGDADTLATGGAPQQQSPLVSVTKPKQSNVGGLVQSLVGMGLKLIPGFETGGPIAADMGSFIVGESGPELLNIGAASGHVTPSHQLRSVGSGGDVHHHYGPIDARGSTDPAAVNDAVRRGILQAAPMIAKMGMQGTKEDRLRRPTTSH